MRPEPLPDKNIWALIPTPSISNGISGGGLSTYSVSMEGLIRSGKVLSPLNSTSNFHVGIQFNLCNVSYPKSVKTHRRAN